MTTTTTTTDPILTPDQPADEQPEVAALKARVAELERDIAEAKTYLQEVDLPDEDLVTKAKRIRDSLDFLTGITRGQARQIDEANNAMRLLLEELAAVRESCESQRRVFRQDNEMLEERLHATRTGLASALTPRPISEAGELREGFVRLFGQIDEDCPFMAYQDSHDTHFLDIRLPQPTEREQFEAELAKHGGDHFAMWKATKGGVA